MMSNMENTEQIGEAERRLNLILKNELEQTFDEIEGPAELLKYRTSDVIRAAIVAARRTYFQGGDFDVEQFQADALEGYRQYRGI